MVEKENVMPDDEFDIEFDVTHFEEDDDPEFLVGDEADDA